LQRCSHNSGSALRAPAGIALDYSEPLDLCAHFGLAVEPLPRDSGAAGDGPES